jgi:hypothetical protein
MLATTADLSDAGLFCIPTILAAILIITTYGAITATVSTLSLFVSHLNLLPPSIEK